MTRKSFMVLLTIAAALRIALIWRAPLWYDENFTLILARLPFAQMMQATAGDVHPPLWYLIEWILFHAAPGLPVWAIRIPALTFSLLAFVMFVQLCDILRIPARVQTLAAFLMAVLPMQIWYAQEGRMYAMLEFLVLAALYTGLTRKWFYFFLASLAMIYTQNYGMFYLAVISLVIVIVDWSTLTNLLTSGIVTMLLYSPWAFVIMSQMTEIEGRYWIMDAGAGAVLKTIYMQFWSSSMLEPGILPAYVLTYIALIIGVWSVIGEKVTSWWIVLTMAFAPVMVAWIASMLWQPLLLFRPLIGTSPFLYLIVAWPVSNLPTFKPSNMRTALYTACFATPIFLFGIAGYYLNVANMKGEGAVSPLLTALDYVRANWQKGDVIYYTDDGPMINLMPYTDLPQYRMPGCDENIGYAPVLGSLSDSTREAIGAQIAQLETIPHQRAWVFAPRSPLHPICYETQIAAIAPEGLQVILVDDNQYLSSGVWLVEAK